MAQVLCLMQAATGRPPPLRITAAERFVADTAVKPPANPDWVPPAPLEAKNTSEPDGTGTIGD
jgi:hypothetical protein